MINLNNIDEKTLSKLVDGHTFSNLLDISIRKCNMKRLNKEFINHFPMLRRLCIMECNIKIIEQDSFSNLKQLNELFLMANPLEFIEKNTFSSLKNLQTIDLSFNKLTNLDPEFIGLGKFVEITNYN